MPGLARNTQDETFLLPSFRALYLLTSVVALLVTADVFLWWLGLDYRWNRFEISLALVGAVVGGIWIVYRTIWGLLEGKVGADLALAIALLAAVALGHYWVGAEVVLIALIGESLEALTFSRTHREIRKIFELQPRLARVRRHDALIELPLADVHVDDMVVIRPGERVPVDGTVISGRSAVDQSTLTGESVPIDKGQGDTVLAGTVNQFGALEVRADQVGEGTTLGKVIRLVAEARKNKGQVERVADRLARYFLPFVLLLAGGTFCFTNFETLLLPGSPSVAPQWVWMPTLSVLVVACPCSLILATPAATMAALAWLARRGVLTTGGAALERLATVSHFAFDKTGTLTKGLLEIGECIAIGNVTQDEVLRLAATAEQSSEHAIGQVLVRAAREQGLELPTLQDFEALPGAGVLARFPDHAERGLVDISLLVGNRRLMTERQVPVSAEVDAAIARLETAAQTPLLISAGSEIVGVIGVRDTIRPEAADVIRQLRELGVNEVVMLTGDRQAVAKQVADAVGVDRFEAELRPEEKANWIGDWCHPRGETHSSDAASVGQQTPIRVAMVGDGVNDAPALAVADVGLALGGVGSDIAAEAGDLILMGDPLTPLPGLIKLSRETVRIIRQNIIVFAFFVNLCGVVLTAWVMPTWSPAWRERSPVAAALFHQVGSVLVLLNAMRLLWFERWHAGWLGSLEHVLSRVCGRLLAPLRPVIEFTVWLGRFRGQLLRLAGLLLLAAYLTRIVVFVQLDEVVLVQRFGRFRAVLEPGPHLRLPPPWELISRQRPQRIHTLEIGIRRAADDVTAANAPLSIEWNALHGRGTQRREMEDTLILTGDQSLVELSATIQYRISDLRAFRFDVRDPERLLKVTAESVIREVVAGQPLLLSDTRVTRRGEANRGPPAIEPTTGAQVETRREILTTGRAWLETCIRDRLQARGDSLGLGVKVLPNGVCLQDVHPPLNVVDAFRDVSIATKDRERLKNEADRYRRQQLISAVGRNAWHELSSIQREQDDEQWAALWRKVSPQLAGEAAANLNAARAFADEQEQLATGEAIRFALQEAAHAENPPLTQWRLFVDALARALAGKKKLILDHSEAGRRHLMLGLPSAATSPMLPALIPNFQEHE